MKPIKYTLIAATPEDLDFLFEVSYTAMKPVHDAFHPDGLDMDQEYQKYKNKFQPHEIEIIKWNNTNVGRLRIVRKSDSLYVGGIQILPDFQGQGIGSAIMRDLQDEAKSKGIYIVLEVHHVNKKAQNFYKKLGFSVSEKGEMKDTLTYIPKNI